MPNILKAARKELVENILPFWAKYSPDGKNGGFIGSVSASGEPDYEADKCLVLNARILWTFSSAYRVLAQGQYLKLAERAYIYIKKYFLDMEFGGAYFMLKADGSPADSRKHVYGNLFLIYAMAEYYRASGSREALRIASATANLLYRSAYDKAHCAFHEAYARNWSVNSALQGVNKPGTVLTMNTQLHALEAFTALLRAMPNDKPTQKRLAEQLNTMLKNVVDYDTKHFKMWFNGEWTAIGHDVSYGHDIEGSWLLYEAASTLDSALGLSACDGASFRRLVKPTSLAMATACLEDGLMPDGSMINEYSPETGHTDRSRIWWVQAETVVGFYNAYQLGDKKDNAFLRAADNCFKYILGNLSDRECGEWFGSADENNRPDRTAAKISAWKCPYHNSRMCFELMERCANDAVASEND